MTPSTELSGPLLAWFKEHGRKDLAWQKSRDAYWVWISEIMLQQTQTTTVIPYFERFMGRFVTIDKLARASVDDVLALWSGLGYYARARNLHKSARIIMCQHQGQFPTDFNDVLALPGVGRSTAGAILAFSSGQRHAILDGNVKRVLCRYYGIEGHPGLKAVERHLWRLADENTPNKNVEKYTQAIMDLGATRCTFKSPNCNLCPLTKKCFAKLNHLQDKLPAPRARKKLETRETRMLIIVNQSNQVLLQKRPPAGIWGGLWSLPEITPGQDIDYNLTNLIGIKGKYGALMPQHKHTFSHFHLNIHPQRIECTQVTGLKEDCLQWFTVDQTAQLGLPKPVKYLLNNLGEYR